jgi:hypothetical protein
MSRRLAVIVAFALPAVALPQATPAEGGVKVYQSVLKSTVWIVSQRPEGTVSGTGSLIDRRRQLVLTNYHVVGDVDRAVVLFPAYRDGKLIAERDWYKQHVRDQGIRGRVVARDKQADLSLIQIDRVPDGAQALPIAGESVSPGQTVHSLGNPGGSGALWVYTPGKVRQVYQKKWAAKAGRETLQFEARVIETDSPTNPGDSGGPLVNDRGELVGVTQGAAIDAQALSIFVDLAEVKRLMHRRSVQALRTDATATTTAAQKEKDPPKKPAREKTITSRDDGKFFGEEAWKKVAPAAEKLFKEKQTDLFIETVMTPWKGDVDKIKAMKPDERKKVFHDLAVERAKEVDLHGVYILVCKNPSFLYVYIPDRSEFPPGFGTKLETAILEAFKDKKFDEGLQKAIDIVLDAKGVGEKK